MGTDPTKTKIYLLKNCVFTCLNLQSTLHLMQYTYQGLFFSLLETVFELVNFDAF